MKFVIRLFMLVASVAGCIGLGLLSSDNLQLAEEISQLEAELGQMSIKEVDRVYIVEIDTPIVPPEVESHLERVWQFRCYLPPGYDVMRISGVGRVAEDGLYLAGGSGSGWGSPQAQATHKLFTVSFRKKDKRWEVFSSFGGSSGTTTWEPFGAEHFGEAVVVQKLVSSELGPRSFEQATILPLLKIFDSTTAEDEDIAGMLITTYAGGLFALCPKLRETQFNELRRGKTPINFNPSWLAKVVGDE